MGRMQGWRSKGPEVLDAVLGKRFPTPERTGFAMVAFEETGA